jgi:phage/plasmid-associated DNA primase
LEGLSGETWEKGSHLYEQFKRWCGDAGKRAMGKHNFYEKLRDKFGIECKQRGEGGVKFKVSGILKCECEVNASEKSSMITNTLAY